MTQALDKTKLKDLIQRTPPKNLMYLRINPVEPKSLEIALKEIQKFVGKDCGEIIVFKRR